MLAEADVGLSLKMPGSNLVATTFPSKVVELASHGLLVLTTDVSDVGVLFNDDTAVVLRDATPGELASKIAGIARCPACAIPAYRAGWTARDQYPLWTAAGWGAVG
jgi:hypothetical protein